MAEDKTTFGHYGASFQEKLAFLILDDRVFSDRMMEVLNIEYLEKKELQVFIEKIFSYKKKFGVHPGYDTMETMIRAGLDAENEATQKLVRDFYTRLKSDDRIFESAEYVKEEALDFCRKQKLKEAMIKSLKLINKHSFDEVGVLINNALKAGADCDFGHDWLADIEERYVPDSRNSITTGWSRFDSIMKGGHGRGELGVAIAPTGAGKSMVLVHLGATAVKAGLTVVHYTLELKDIVVAQRYDSCITGIPINDLPDNKEKVIEKVKQVDGQLIVKEYPTKTATTNTIRAHLEKLKRQGIVPDMIIVDYADLLRPLSGKKEKRDELESIYEELRAIMQESNAAGWTASQTNRQGLNAEVITLDSISEAFNKCFIADFIFTVSRNHDDKRCNTGRCLVAKNRNGGDGFVFDMMMDPSNVDIKIIGHHNFKNSNYAPVNHEAQKKLLQDDYAAFKSQQRGK